MCGGLATRLINDVGVGRFWAGGRGVKSALGLCLAGMAALFGEGRQRHGLGSKPEERYPHSEGLWPFTNAASSCRKLLAADF